MGGGRYMLLTLMKFLMVNMSEFIDLGSDDTAGLLQGHDISSTDQPAFAWITSHS